MNIYFNIRYEMDREEVHRAIERRIAENRADYICVTDGVIVNMANRNPDYLDVVNGGLFSICDSSYVPLYIRMIHGHKHRQYCGCQIFRDIVSKQKYRMMFLGSRQPVLNGLRAELAKWNPDVLDMKFIELPFLDVDDFDYPAIADMIDKDGADIIWVSLGAPKQEIFMSRLKPFLSRGIMIAIGAAFKFYSGQGAQRAPDWMVKYHLEFIYRLGQEPAKQFRRCFNIVRTLPRMLHNEWNNKKHLKKTLPINPVINDRAKDDTPELILESNPEIGKQKTPELILESNPEIGKHKAPEFIRMAAKSIKPELIESEA